MHSSLNLTAYTQQHNRFYFQNIKKSKMQRFTVLPVALYRFQSGKKPILRQYSAQTKKKLRSYDYKLGENKLYNPTEGDKYAGPNGFTLRPVGMNLAELFFEHFNYKFIYQLPQNLELPDPFIVIHEGNDHYSFQTKVPIEPQKFQELTMQFLQKQKQITVEEMSAKLEALLKPK